MAIHIYTHVHKKRDNEIWLKMELKKDSFEMDSVQNTLTHTHTHTCHMKKGMKLYLEGWAQKKKVSIHTQWQLYKLNGGINYMIKLNDSTRKWNTFISSISMRMLKPSAILLLGLCAGIIFFLLWELKSDLHQLTHRI